MTKFWKPGESSRIVFIDSDPLPLIPVPKPTRTAFRCSLCEAGYPVTHQLHGEPVEIPDPVDPSD